MTNCFTYNKIKYERNDVLYIDIFFDNGDYINLEPQEIIDVSLNTYDKLVYDKKGISPVASKGYIKLKIAPQKVLRLFDNGLVYDMKKFNTDRHDYIINRCLKEKYVRKIRLFNDLEWSHIVLGDFCVKIEGEYLILEVLPRPYMGSDMSEKHYINMGPISKKHVSKLCLVFEDYESFYVYDDEIVDLNLALNEELTWDTNNLVRTLKGGLIRLELFKGNNQRESDMYSAKKLTVKDYEKRIYSGSTCDICNLYINSSYKMHDCDEEIICVNGIEEGNNSSLDPEDNDYSEYFASGYAKKLEDGTVVITFGKRSKERIKKYK